jgi:signal transduction histidine kinase
MCRFPFLLLAVLCLAPQLYAQPTLRLEGKKQYNISPYLLRYIGGAAGISPKQAFRLYSAGKFRVVHKTNNLFINDGLVNKESWWVLTIRTGRSYESTEVLEFLLSGANTVDCYTVNEHQEVRSLELAQQDHSASGGLLSHSAAYHVNIQPGQDVLLLMHVVNRGQLMYIPAALYDLDYFTEVASQKHNFLGIFQGIFFFIIVFNLLLFLTTFDKIYLFYLLYAFSISLFALNETGSAAYTLFFVSVARHFSGQTFLFAGFSVWLLLMLQFLNAVGNRALFRGVLVLSGIDLFTAALPDLGSLTGWSEALWFQQTCQTVVILLFATNLIFILAVNVIRIVKGNRLAIFYAVANLPVVLGALIYYGNYFGLTDIVFDWLNPVALGLSIETFVISFGFAYRFNVIHKEKQELQKEITRQIIAIQESEQKRIAQDLHDELGGDLAAIKMTLQSFHLEAEKSQLLDLLIDKASANARNIAHNLMPPEFNETTLGDLLSHRVAHLTREGRCRFEYHHSGEDGRFTKQNELVIYRIMLELINNCVRHAQASEAAVQLIYHPEHLSIMVEDNGCGFRQGQPRGIGLENVQSRVNYLSGVLIIDTGTTGTTITIKIPYI